MFGKVKQIPWDKFFRIEHAEMVTLRIIPDRTTENRKNYKLIRALHDLYVQPLGRLSFGKWYVKYQPQARFWYDLVISENEIKFYFTISKNWEAYARQKIAQCWPKASVEYAEQSETHVPIENTQVAEMVLKRHNIFGLHCDRTEDTQPIGAIMATVSDMKKGDIARLSICAEPINRMNWNDHADNAHKEFSDGKVPQRKGFNKRKLLLALGQCLESVFQGFNDLVLGILGHTDKEEKPEDFERKQILINGQLDRATLAKRNEPTFKTRIRIATHSENELRREIASRTIANAFVEVAGDNELERVEVKGKAKVRIIYELNSHKLQPLTIIEPDSTVLCASELGKIVQLPGAGLQDEYAEQLETIKLRQTELPAIVTKNGMKLGTQKYKHQTLDIYQPTANEDELCLPHVGIGGMGTGKTKGFASNWIVEAIENGYGAIGIDPAKREMGAEVAVALPEDKIIRIDLSKVTVALDWCEVKYSARAKNRLANTMMAFFGMNGEDAYQTERYIRAGVMGMTTGKLSELIKIFEDAKYRTKIIKKMSAGINKTTLESFGKETEARQRQILAPIYNRMAMILGDEYLAECMESDNSLDMVELLQQRKAVIIDIPSADFDPLAIDLLVNLISTKIDLSMRLRPEENQFPFFVVMDEPHQYLRSATLWKSAAVESRKWRLGYVWLFHSWEQIPKDLGEIIKAAGPHYHIYTSSQKTYRDLAPEIAPFTVDEGIKTPRFHAINVLRAGGVTVRPFMAQMLPPPSMRKGA